MEYKLVNATIPGYETFTGELVLEPTEDETGLIGRLFADDESPIGIGIELTEVAYGEYVDAGETIFRGGDLSGGYTPDLTM